jgi:hypothetical protein
MGAGPSWAASLRYAGAPAGFVVSISTSDHPPLARQTIAPAAEWSNSIAGLAAWVNR